MTTSSTGDFPSSSGSAFHNQFNSIFSLPSDLNVEIFSHLNQQECLICMAVCRDWYNCIPQYTQSLWKELQLDTCDSRRQNKRRERCMGIHVKKVTLTSVEGRMIEAPLYALMQQLLDNGCTEIDSLALIKWNTTDQDTFLNLLRQLAPRLTHLRIKSHGSDLAILNVLYASPELTHFTCEYTYAAARGSHHPSISIIPSNYRSRITHLWLDVFMNRISLEPIIKMCPELRCFIDSSLCRWTSHTEWVEFNQVSLELDTILDLCPKITFLASNFCHQQLYELDNPGTCDYTGLKYLTVTSGYGVDKITRLLESHEASLEHLSISNSHGIDVDLSELLSSLKLSNLRTLISHRNHFMPISMVLMFNHCPVLETIDLCTQDLFFDMTSFQYLHTMNNLQSLQWEGIELDDELSLFTVLQRFPALKELIISKLTASLKIPQDSFEFPRQLKRFDLSNVTWRENHEDSNEAAIMQFLQYITSRTDLETVRLIETPVYGFNAVMEIAAIPTLKSLDIQLNPSLYDDKLLRFFKVLKSTVIESLTLSFVSDLSFADFDALAELPLLSTLNIQKTSFGAFVTNVGIQGLQHLLRKSESLIIASFETISLWNGNELLRADKLSAIAQDITPKSNRSHSRLEKWDIQMAPGYSLRDVVITRFAK